MTRRLVILMIALQPALLVEGQACLLSVHTGTSPSKNPVLHGEACCGASDCCLPTRCGCETRPTDGHDHPHWPLAPAPSPTRVVDVLATPTVLPIPAFADESSLSVPADALPQPPPHDGVGERLSFLCLWLT